MSYEKSEIMESFQEVLQTEISVWMSDLKTVLEEKSDVWRETEEIKKQYSDIMQRAEEDLVERLVKVLKHPVMSIGSDLMVVQSQLNKIQEDMLSLRRDFECNTNTTKKAVTMIADVMDRSNELRVELRPVKTFSDAIKADKAKKDPNKKVYMLASSPGDESSSSKTKLKLKDILRPTGVQLHVTGLKSLSSDVATDLDDDIWLSLARNDRMKEHGLALREAQQRMPIVALYGVDSSLSEAAIIIAARSQNFLEVPREDFIRQFIPLCRVGNRNSSKGAWVIKCSEELRKKLILNGTIYIGCNACKVVNTPDILRCFKCHQVGHVASKCKVGFTCLHCAETGHQFKDCIKKSEPKVCSNCMRFGKDYNHDVLSADCPYFQRQIELVALKTRYG